MEYHLPLSVTRWIGTVWGKLKESLFIDAIQASLLFGAKKLLIVWVLIGHEFAFYLERFSSLIS